MAPIKRVDANQPEIVKALRKIPGVSVTCTHMVGHGYPDINVGYMGRTWLFEIKMPGGTLTPDEQTWFANWTGCAAVIHNVDEAWRILQGY